jgi:cold-inducible RNA-binding protein
MINFFMPKKLFVGNLPFSLTSEKLEEIFSAIGKVLSVNIVIDRMTQRSRGFGFVEYETDEDAQKAIAQLNGNDMDGRQIVVKEALPRPERTE